MTAAEHPIAPEDVMAFWDGELPSERAAVVSAHVAGCDVCRRLGHDLSGVARDLSLWQVEQAPVTLRAPASTAVSSAAAPDARMRRRWLPPISFVAGVTAAAALVIAVGSLLPRGKNQVSVVRASTAESREGSYRMGIDNRIQDVASPAQAGRDPAGQRRQGQGQGQGRQGQGQGQGMVAGQLSQQSRNELPLSQASRSQAPDKASPGTKIARTITLRLVAKDMNVVRPEVDRILALVGGFVGQIDASGERGGQRAFRATVRIPVGGLDTALAAFRGLGEVIGESQNADDVTEQAVDLDARLSNARNTESRLVEVLRNRTGKVADVLEVEREIARVREVIERTDAERTNLARRVEYATLTLDIEEARKAAVDFGPLPVSSRLMNAMVDGTTKALESALDATLLLVRFGPVTLLWLALAGWPAFVIARRYRGSHGSHRSQEG